jgi:LysR family hydrogen peroxide-inducible transcriptional activator
MIALPTLRQFRHLAALAEHRNFGRAAAACAVTQSTLSASLKELEDILGVALVDRTKRSVVFTPFGEETVRRARAILDEAEDLARSAQSAGEPLSGTIRLGVIPTVAPYLLPRVLARLRAKYPALRLYLREDLTDRLVERLRSGELDAVLLALPYELGTLETETLFEDRFSFCCRPDHPLANTPEVAAGRLGEESLLLLEDGHCLRDHALAACALSDRAKREPFEATSLGTLVQMVDNGLGVTLLPQLAIDAGILKGTDLATIPLEDKAESRTIGLAWRARTGRREEFQLLARELKRLAGRK